MEFIQRGSFSLGFSLLALTLVVAGCGPREQELRLADQVKGLSSDTAQLKGELASAQQAVSEGNAQLEIARTEAVGLRVTVEARDKALGQAGPEVQALKARQTEAEARAAELGAANQRLTRDLGTITTQRAAMRSEQQVLMTQLAATGQDLGQAKQRAFDLNKTYTSLLSEKDQLVMASAKRKAELDATRKALESAQTEIARLTGARGIYTVQTVDSLSSVAAFFYRDGTRWPDVFKANELLITNPDQICEVMRKTRVARG